MLLMKTSHTRFKKEERLRSKAEFDYVFSQHTRSKKSSIPGLSIRYTENGLLKNRIGILVTRKYGNAVKRNRIKRHIREIYRHMKNKLKTGYDIVVIVYPGECNYEKRKCQVYSLIRKAALFDNVVN